ncbi:uncharacterized protein LOC113228236 [Hyposmocoma kahamanoa]|uniref:uncharacterized protein LOC113228236 n=1 Tax=Hyposmocoma kahamanoa TaxID=1477025 RepID=UPI000E6DA51E|nr:uncharacterized protein LOC113228236 [Hyposmocoma kahamanoa]
MRGRRRLLLSCPPRSAARPRRPAAPPPAETRGLRAGAGGAADLSFPAVLCATRRVAALFNSNAKGRPSDTAIAYASRYERRRPRTLKRSVAAFFVWIISKRVDQCKTNLSTRLKIKVAVDRSTVETAPRLGRRVDFGRVSTPCFNSGDRYIAALWNQLSRHGDGGTRGRTVCRDQVETRQRASDLAEGRRLTLPVPVRGWTEGCQCNPARRDRPRRDVTGRRRGRLGASGPRGFGSLGRPAAARAAAPALLRQYFELSLFSK